MNNINLIGRITKDLELRATPSGKFVCEFNLAVNRFKEGTDFITCQVWGTQAENLSKYQSKGSRIAVVGALRVDQFQDKDGNNRYKTFVLVNSVEFLDTVKSNEKNENDPITNMNYKTMAASVEINDSDLPF